MWWVHSTISTPQFLNLLMDVPLSSDGNERLEVTGVEIANQGEFLTLRHNSSKLLKPLVLNQTSQSGVPYLHTPTDT